jgi:hypothetical protein
MNVHWIVLILDFPMNLLLTQCSLHFHQPTSPSHGLVCSHSSLLEMCLLPHRTYNWIALASVACHVHPQPTPINKCCGWFPCGSFYFLKNLNWGHCIYPCMSWNFVTLVHWSCFEVDLQSLSIFPLNEPYGFLDLQAPSM